MGAAWVVVVIFAVTASYFALGLRLQRSGTGMFAGATDAQLRTFRRFMVGNAVAAAVALVVAVALWLSS
jgi:hypothetical protein